MILTNILLFSVHLHFNLGCCDRHKNQLVVHSYFSVQMQTLFSFQLNYSYFQTSIPLTILFSKQFKQSGKEGSLLYLSSLQMLLLQLRRWLAAATLGGMGGLDGKQNSTTTKSAAIIPNSASSQKKQKKNNTTFIMKPQCQHQISQRFYGFRLNLSLLIRKRA